MAISLMSCAGMAKARPQHESINQKLGRRASFEESRNVEHENISWCFEDCKLSWFTKFEYQQMKEGSFSQAKQIWRRERRSSDENSYMNATLRVYDTCCEASQETDACILPESDEALLTMLVGMANTRAGLEKIFIREIANDKRHRRSQLLNLVLCVQNTHKAGSPRACAELTRLSSESVSRASRLFARHMAKALEASLY